MRFLQSSLRPLRQAQGPQETPVTEPVEVSVTEPVEVSVTEPVEVPVTEPVEVTVFAEVNSLDTSTGVYQC
jgi:hypothetical protein